MKDYILKKLKENKHTIQQTFNVKKLILVGSFARNEATKNSDVDILVDMPKDFDKFFDLKYYLEEILGKKVDLAYYDTLRHYIKKEIQKDKIDV